MEETAPSNPQLFYTIEIIDEAIAAGRQVAFIYNAYGTDKRLHPKRDQEYIVNPYQIAATNGRYYLIGNYDKYGNAIMRSTVTQRLWMATVSCGW